MSASTKLSNAVKALCYLSGAYPDPKNSGEIAQNTGVNASKLRMILSMLVKNNIVESIQGTNGGFVLKKNPAGIHLQEIYCAIEDRKAFYLDVSKSNGKLENETQKLNYFFLNLFSDIQVDIEDKMRKITLQSILSKINSNQ
jgi:Rrf2 family protein